MNLITSRQGKPHITVTQDAHVNRESFGISSGVFGSNHHPTWNAQGVTISAIAGLIQGRKWNVDPNTTDFVPIATGTAGVKRYDIICIKVTSTGNTQSAEWAVVQGTPSASPSAPQSYAAGDLDNGDSEAWYGVFRVYLNGVGISNVGLMADVIPSNNANSGTVLKRFTDTTYAENEFALDVSNYSFIEIVANNGSSCKLACDSDNTGCLVYGPMGATSNLNSYFRRVKIKPSTGTIQFYNCIQLAHGSSTTGAISNNICLPRAIIGYKY